MKLDVGIAGAGYAGTAAALFLARAGHRVTLYEEAAEPAAVGAGILLQPSGLRVLAELGLLEAVLARGARVDGIYCRTATGRAVLDLSYGDFRPEWFGVGMHRGALFEILFGAALAAGVEVQAGCSVQGLVSERRGRRRLVFGDGRQSEPHELVIASDGARSELRKVFAGASRAEPYPWGALWYVANDPERIYDGRLFQVAEGTERLLGFLPSGLGPTRGDGVPKVSLFWSIRTDSFDEIRRGSRDSFEAWKREVTRLEPRARFVVDQIPSGEALLPAAYLDVVMEPSPAPGVVFVGDAGHAMSPQLGQGCNLALEDARLLAACIGAERGLGSALERFATLRREHVAYYQFASRALTPLFQSSYGWLGPLRDQVLGPLCRLPVTRDLMLATLAGVQCGLLGPHQPLEPIHAALSVQRS